jgi:hypothetical protein
VSNWAEYDASLRAPVNLTVWFTAEVIAAWRAEPRTGRSGQPRYSALAIAAALTLRVVFRLALRQTEGLIGSILQLLALDLGRDTAAAFSRQAADALLSAASPPGPLSAALPTPLARAGIAGE